MAAFFLALTALEAPALDARADAPAPMGEEERQDAAQEKEVERLYADGKYDAALAAAERLRAAREARLGATHPKTASALSDVGGLKLAKGDIVGAQKLLPRAVEILEKAPGSEADLAAALANMAALHKAKGDLKAAEEHYTRVVSLERKGGEARASKLGTALASLGDFYRATRRLDAAKTLLEQAIVIHEKHGPEEQLLRDRIALAHVHRGEGRVALMEKQYEEARILAERLYGQDDLRFGRLLVSMAWASAGANNQDGAAHADKLYRRAEPILLKWLGPDHPELATLYGEWSRTHIRNEKGFAKALELRARSLEIEDRNLEKVLASGTEEEKLQFARRFVRSMDSTVSLQMGFGLASPEATRLILTTILRRKGIVLDAMAGSVAALRSQDGADTEKLLDELVRARGALSSAVVAGPRGETSDAWRAELARLGGKADAIEAKVSERSSAYRRASPPVTIEAVQDALPEDAALMEIVHYKYQPPQAHSQVGEDSGTSRYMLYLLRKRGAPRWFGIPPNYDASVIDMQVERVRDGLQDPNNERFYDTLHLLQSNIFGRVREHLEGVKHIFVSPDGSLNLLPFGALLGDKGRFLVEDYTFTYLSSGRDLLRFDKPAPRRAGPLLVANPDYDAPGEAPEVAAADRSLLPTLARVRFTPLPGTAEEARAISPLLPEPTVRVERIAAETALKQAAGPRVVHVATHGFFLDPNQRLAQGKKRGFELDVPGQTKAPPKEGGPKYEIINPLFLSGIALAGANVRHGLADDGILTAYEAAALDLRGTDLIVLSACETGVGQVDAGEGVHGLRRALVIAGARTQVMSLWQVDDEATRDLMSGYYKKLFREGKGRSEGLREVQLEMLAKKDRQHPFFWAAFIPSGAWGPLEGTKQEARTNSARLPPGGARGCGCEVAGTSNSPSGAWIGLGLAAVASFARRRRFARPIG
jgi:MYXO-CTERM domain-containing protein